MKVPKFDDVSHLASQWPFKTQPPSRCYRSQCLQWTVQVWVQDSKWMRVGIRKCRKGEPREPLEITERWSFMQAIKEQLFPGRLAIEFYPKPSDVIDDAPMRWLFVAPVGYQFPSSLGSNGLTA